MNELLLHANGTGSLPERIYARMLEAILRGDFAPSGKLPAEGDLAASFGVSRPTVREALSRLRSDGIIDSRRGAGSYVIGSPGVPVASATPIKSLADVERYYAFRSCVEAGAVAGAAEFRDAADVQALQEAYDAWSSAIDQGHSGVDEDLAFHLAIARASHTPFFVATIETSVAPIRQFMELARTATEKKSPERLRTNKAEHQEILDAIVRRAAPEAADAIRAHIRNAKRRLFENTPLA